jgi:hypothetical protein
MTPESHFSCTRWSVGIQLPYLQLLAGFVLMLHWSESHTGELGVCVGLGVPSEWAPKGFGRLVSNRHSCQCQLDLFSLGLV